MKYRLSHFRKFAYPLILLITLTISFPAHGGGKFRRKPKDAQEKPATQPQKLPSDSKTVELPPGPCQPESLPDCNKAPKCDPQLEAFQSECILQCQFNALKDAFKKYGIDPEYLTEFRSRRLIAGKDFKPSTTVRGQEIFRPWEIYKPKPKTWVEWERGNFFREQLSKALDSRQKTEGQWELKLQDLQLLHRKYLDKDLVTPTPFLYRWKSFQKKYPLPGTLRQEGSTDSGFTATVSLEDLKGLQELQETKTRETGEPYINLKVKRKLGWKFQVEVKYLKPYQTEKATIDLLNEINQGVSGFISKTKNDESPIGFAARIQRTFIAIHPFHEGNGRMSRFIQDLISKKLNLPLIPGGNIQQDVSTRLDRYQAKTRDEVASSLLRLSGCLREYQDKECYSKLPENKQSLSISGRCKPIYEDHSRIEQSVITRLVQDICTSKSGTGSDDTEEKLERIKTQMGDIAACIQTTQRQDLSVESSVARQMTDQAKVQFIEALAEPLKEDLVTYTWVTGKPEAFSRKHLYTNSVVFNHVILGKGSQLVDNKTSAGNGLYVSKNPYDSRGYAVTPKRRDQYLALPKPGERLYNSAELDLLSQMSKEGHLLRVKIKKGQKVLNLQNKRVAEVLKENHLYDDVFILNPNVIIDGYHEGVEWMNIKLKDRNAFTVKNATITDFSLVEAASTQHYTKDAGNVGVPFGQDLYDSMIEYHRKRLQNSKQNWENHSEVGSTFFDPLLIRCYQKTEEKSKIKVKEVELSNCDTREYRHIPKIDERIKSEEVRIQHKN